MRTRLQWSLLFVGVTIAFSPLRVHHTSKGKRSTELYVFDFFKERSKEGLDQLEVLRESVSKGKLSEGLGQVASYTSVTNKKFADGLAKSRNRFLQNLEGIVTGVSPEELLEELEDVLLQADLGAQTAEDIVSEVESLREDSTKLLSQADLKSIMRGKIIEALETPGRSNAIHFTDTSDMPTVLFVMGANGTPPFLLLCYIYHV